MTDLVKELGVDYMRDRFGGCMFYDNERRPCYVDSGGAWGRGKVRVTVLEGPVEEVQANTVQVPETFFTDLSIFSVPPLGWRMAADGAYMAHFRRNNKSYQRALNPKVALRTVSPATQFLIDTDNVDDQYYNRTDTTVALIMTPKYMAFREGIQRMKDGDLFSFCVTPNLAVLPAPDNKQAIYFNLTQVGMVEEDGGITCSQAHINALIKESIK